MYLLMINAASIYSYMALPYFAYTMHALCLIGRFALQVFFFLVHIKSWHIFCFYIFCTAVFPAKNDKVGKTLVVHQLCTTGIITQTSFWGSDTRPMQCWWQQACSCCSSSMVLDLWLGAWASHYGPNPAAMQWYRVGGEVLSPSLSSPSQAAPTSKRASERAQLQLKT